MPRDKPKEQPAAVPQIEFDSLPDLAKGAAREAVNAKIRECINDLIERGREDGKARHVAIDLELYWQNGAIVAHIGCQAKLPPMRTPPTLCEERVRANGECGIVFRRSNPENVDQPTFDDVGEQ